MSRGSPQNNSATILALLGLTAVAVGLLALCALVLPQFVGILSVGFGFFFFVVFHYLLWGRWLSNRSAGQDDEDE